MSALPFFGHSHRDQRVPRLALVCDQYSDRHAAACNRLGSGITGDSSTGVYFGPLAAGGPLDAPRLPRGGFGRSWMFDDVVGV